MIEEHPLTHNQKRLLLLFALIGEQGICPTRLQKIVFLICVRFPKIFSLDFIDGYSFKRWNFGPFSEALVFDMQLLDDELLIVRKFEKEISVLCITQSGKRWLEHHDLCIDIITTLLAVLKEWEQKPLTKMLCYIDTLPLLKNTNNGDYITFPALEHQQK